MTRFSAFPASTARFKTSRISDFFRAETTTTREREMKRGDNFEARVFGGGTDENDETRFDVGRKASC